jgi:hypothetical protein
MTKVRSWKNLGKLVTVGAEYIQENPPMPVGEQLERFGGIQLPGDQLCLVQMAHLLDERTMAKWTRSNHPYSQRVVRIRMLLDTWIATTPEGATSEETLNLRDRHNRETLAAISWAYIGREPA